MGDINVDEKEKSATKNEDTEQGTRSSILNWLNLGKTENKTEDVESFKRDDIPNDTKQESDIGSNEKSAEENVSQLKTPNDNPVDIEPSLMTKSRLNRTFSNELDDCKTEIENIQSNIIDTLKDTQGNEEAINTIDDAALAQQEEIKGDISEKAPFKPPRTTAPTKNIESQCTGINSTSSTTAVFNAPLQELKAPKTVQNAVEELKATEEKEHGENKTDHEGENKNDTKSAINIVDSQVVVEADNGNVSCENLSEYYKKVDEYLNGSKKRKPDSDKEKEQIVDGNKKLNSEPVKETTASVPEIISDADNFNLNEEKETKELVDESEEDKLTSKLDNDFVEQPVKGMLIAKENTQESFEKKDMPPLAITAPSYASIVEKKVSVSDDDTKFSSPIDVIALPSQKRSTIIITDESENKPTTKEGKDDEGFMTVKSKHVCKASFENEKYSKKYETKI